MDMAAAIAARGHEVQIATTDQDGPNRLQVPSNQPVVREGVRIRYFRSTFRGLWPISVALWRSLAREVATFDLIHIHSLYLFHGAVAAHYCRKRGVPYILRPHGSLDPFLYKRHRFRKAAYEFLIERRNLRRAAALHFTAEEERKLAEPYSLGAPSFVVPLGLHLDEYSALPPPGTLRAAYPEIASRRIVLHFGRINFKKGLDILVDAFAIAASRVGNIHLVIAGPDNERFGDQIRRRLADRGLTGRATFTGMLQGELKLAAFRDASVFALPSYSENFGIAAVEAMACGVPVVISDKVNIWREVKAANAGLVAACDATSFAECLLDVLSDDRIARQMGLSGRALVAQRFDWSLVADALETAYRNIVSRTHKATMNSDSAPAIG